MNRARPDGHQTMGRRLRGCCLALIDKDVTPSYLSAGFKPHKALKSAMFTGALAAAGCRTNGRIPHGIDV